MTFEQFIHEHIRQDVTELVPTLAKADTRFWDDARALTVTTLDYEAAARAAGWGIAPDKSFVFSAHKDHRRYGENDVANAVEVNWQAACKIDNLRPISRTPTEFYAVSFATPNCPDPDCDTDLGPGLFDWLRAEGERVLPLAGMMVWARYPFVKDWGPEGDGGYLPLSADPALRKIWDVQK